MSERSKTQNHCLSRVCKVIERSNKKLYHFVIQSEIKNHSHVQVSCTLQQLHVIAFTFDWLRRLSVSSLLGQSHNLCISSGFTPILQSSQTWVSTGNTVDHCKNSQGTPWRCSGLVVSALVPRLSCPEVQALAKNTMLCSWARHFYSHSASRHPGV